MKMRQFLITEVKSIENYFCIIIKQLNMDRNNDYGNQIGIMFCNSVNLEIFFAINLKMYCVFSIFQFVLY